MPECVQKIKEEGYKPEATAYGPEKRSILRTLGGSVDWAANAGARIGLDMLTTRERGFLL